MAKGSIYYDDHVRHLNILVNSDLNRKRFVLGTLVDLGTKIRHGLKIHCGYHRKCLFALLLLSFPQDYKLMKTNT